MIDKSILKQLKIFVIGSLILFAITGGSIVYLVVSKAMQSQQLVNAQVKVYEAQEKNVGAPQIIEQRYFSPNK
ncbi:hypothetical protein M0R04_10415 [Candidatus Dojkabacteria bacterium]|jgi:hypothetical protein|nr:hypothetical protein [Candidatus Dojkabacteria bacterium]